ncbi:TerB N-terminal domain-containing protein [Methanolobus sp. WCC5]|uniref:TerB N-terminal domain-containing protein n=1 Tax=Methanolobus sp. WCC5 TaxID=3125785 RepID=UPI003253FD68
MGIFDFLKRKTEQKETVNVVIQEATSPSGNAVATYFDGLTSHDRIFNLLWFADGKFKNYDPEQDQNVLFENELFRITFSFGSEPSLLSSKFPIKPTSFSEANHSIGYFPSYEGLTPEQRWVYLNWLKDIRQQVDIGYVFVFYYGLERHLVYGNYKDAVDVILLLRKYHKNGSFQGYSLSALILASILHKDKETLEKALESIDNGYPDNIVLIAKYLMKMDLNPEEIVSMASSVGFKNKRYINQYPDLFKEVLSSKLQSEFGNNTYPLCSLEANFESKKSLVFANISLPSDTRSPSLPSIIDCPVFKESILKLLSSTHEDVKRRLLQMRKEGIAPEPKISPKSISVKCDLDSTCPYCNKELAKMPQRKTKCPHCCKPIHVMKHLTGDEKILMTEDEARDVAFVKERLNGYDMADYFTKLAIMSVEWGKEPKPIDVLWRIYTDQNNEAIQKGDIDTVRKIQFSMAMVLYHEGKDFIGPLREAKRMRLVKYRREGLKKVRIVGPASCEACSENHGKVFTIDDAINKMPIPNPECTTHIRGGPTGWCRCRYNAYFDDSELDG